VTSKANKLIKEARACKLCAPHLPLGPKPILQLHPKAKILLVGQAPGTKAHQAGIPFSDLSGHRLRSWLGVTREQFYDEQLFAILPIGFCYPGRGSGGDLPPRPECAPAWRKPLLALLPDIQLTLLMGRYAIDWHLPDERARPLTDIVTDWRKNWSKTLVLPHPSPRNVGWFKRNPWFEKDVVPHLQARAESILRDRVHSES